MKRGIFLFLGALCLQIFGAEKSPFLDLVLDPSFQENQPATLTLRSSKEKPLKTGGYCLGEKCERLKNIRNPKDSADGKLKESISTVKEVFAKNAYVSVIYTVVGDENVYRRDFQLLPTSETPSKLKFILVPEHEGLAYKAAAPKKTVASTEEGFKSLALEEEVEFANGYKVSRIDDDSYKLCTDKTCQVVNLKQLLEAFQKADAAAMKAKTETKKVGEVPTKPKTPDAPKPVANIDAAGQAYSVADAATLDAVIARNKAAGIRSQVLYSAQNCGNCQERKAGFFNEAKNGAADIRYYILEVPDYSQGIPGRPDIRSFPTEYVY